MPETNDSRSAMISPVSIWTTHPLFLVVVAAVLSSVLTTIAILFGHYMLVRDRLAALEHRVTRVDDLNARIASVEADLRNSAIDLTALKEKTTVLDRIRTESATAQTNVELLVQKANDHIADLTELKATLTDIQVASGRLDVGLSLSTQRLSSLEQEVKSACATVSDIRDRVSRLEALSDSN